jgi:hypothetical protein
VRGREGPRLVRWTLQFPAPRQMALSCHRSPAPRGARASPLRAGHRDPGGTAPRGQVAWLAGPSLQAHHPGQGRSAPRHPGPRGLQSSPRPRSTDLVWLWRVRFSKTAEGQVGEPKPGLIPRLQPLRPPPPPPPRHPTGSNPQAGPRCLLGLLPSKKLTSGATWSLER